MNSTKNASSTQIVEKRYIIHSLIRVGFYLCINRLVHTRGNCVGHTCCFLLGWAE